jgi:hypothetical protein
MGIPAQDAAKPVEQSCIPVGKMKMKGTMIQTEK